MCWLSLTGETFPLVSEDTFTTDRVVERKPIQLMQAALSVIMYIDEHYYTQ